MNAPEIVQQLAAQAGGNPIAWKEYDGYFVIVFEDGRKLRFEKKDAGQPRHSITNADIKEHVGEDGKNKSRKRKDIEQ